MWKSRSYINKVHKLIQTRAHTSLHPIPPHAVFKNSLQTPGTDSIMDPDKKKTDQRKQEAAWEKDLADTERFAEFLRQHVEPTFVEPTPEQREEMETMNRQLQKKALAYPINELHGWIDMVQDTNDITQIRKILHYIMYTMNINADTVKSENSTQFKLTGLHFAKLNLIRSGLTDLSGFERLCTIDEGTRAKLSAMANTLQLHGGITEKEAAMLDDKEKIIVDSDDSDDFEPRKKQKKEASAKDAAPPVLVPHSEEEEDYGEMEEVSDEEDDPNDPDFKP